MSIFNNANRFASIGAYYSLQFDDFQFTPHRHNSCEIMFFSEGQCLVEVNGQKRRLTQGQLIFIDQNVVHRLIVEKDIPCKILNVEFACRPGGAGTDLHHLKKNLYLFRYFLDHPSDYFIATDTGNFCYAIKALILELEKIDHIQDKAFIINNLLTQVFIELSRCVCSEASPCGLGYVRNAQSYISAHIDSMLSVPVIAKHVGINAHYLEKLFRLHLNTSVASYVSLQRLQQASFLLKNTSQKITDIAFDLGFNSRQHFGLVFKNMYHCSPSDFRKQTHLQRDVITDNFKRIRSPDSSSAKPAHGR